MVSLGESFGLTFEASGGHWESILRPWEVIGTQFRRPWAQRVSKPILSHAFWGRLRAMLETCRSFFFETGLLFVFCWLLFWRTQKVSQNYSQKGLLGEPQEGSRLGGSSIFTFAAEPKKGSKMGAKMERLGSQARHYTPFVRPCRENRPSKSINLLI